MDEKDTILVQLASKSEELTPQQYFDAVKESKKTITDSDLNKIYDNCLDLINKYVITGQTRGLRKILFCLDCITKEREIIKLGIDTYIYRDDIDFYIDKVASNTVKIIEIERYEREIPDEIVDVVAKTKDIFDQLYIVFTDYTGKEERKVEASKRTRDPILFGTFQDKQQRIMVDRFYYLGDWIDDYCDLTLTKLVNEIGTKRNVIRTISTPKDIDELREQINSIQETSTNVFRQIPDAEKPKQKKGIAKVINTFLSKKKEK